MNLRKSAQGQACSICGTDGETTVLAHLRVGGNAGVGIKPPDHHALYACHGCHTYIDGEGRGDYKIQLIGYLRQIDKWLAEGKLRFT